MAGNVAFMAMFPATAFDLPQTRVLIGELGRELYRVDERTPGFYGALDVSNGYAPGWHWWTTFRPSVIEPRPAASLHAGSTLTTTP